MTADARRYPASAFGPSPGSGLQHAMATQKTVQQNLRPEDVSIAPFVRVDVWSLSPNDPTITYYADAVRAMQAKPESDANSLAYQAAIHGKDDGAPLPLWNECRHGGWFFVSWHRAYLYYFERIVRAEVLALWAPSVD